MYHHMAFHIAKGVIFLSFRPGYWQMHISSLILKKSRRCALGSKSCFSIHLVFIALLSQTKNLHKTHFTAL